MSSEKSKVYFGSVQHGRNSAFASFAAKVDKITDLLLEETPIEKKDKVAVKMHLGFNDGYQTIPVFFVRRIVEAVKKRGGYPFVTDNPTSVYNAVNRGYTQETCGCPIIPIAGVKDGYTTSVDVNYRGIDKLELAGALKDADVLVDLSHAKGHGACGYGGAIKNLALGGYSGPTRWRKIHGASDLDEYWDKTKGNPELAKKLVESCPYGALSYDEEKDDLKREYHDCHQCMTCLQVDGGLGAVKLPRESYTAFNEMMAIATKEVLKTFDPAKVMYINFLTQITIYCDCMGLGQSPFINDIGVVGSKDIVAIETATLDLIKKEEIIEKNIPPYFKHVNLDPNEDFHPFTRVHGPYKDPYETVQFAEKMGLGTSKYELIEILSPEETMKMEPPKRVFEGEPTFF
ncbi:MAG: DUF362 domain-containing protein [Candidatus Heimdallarchaeota archaeon]|nr:DUF362 domain-containing protein [Candidatus Heimdallarchaeota archaeon]MCK4609707.1 DUF362 domain-containing protein [Candidatus Heimdallarchaeota archaeon]